MSTFVRMFQPRFAPLVESGEKNQTVRLTPKRMPKPGDRISLRCWTGAPYRSKQRVLRESVITQVTPLELCFIRCRLLIWIRGEKPRHLSASEIETFARADGFKDSAEMAHWFQTAHGLPFAGVLIEWDAEDKDAPASAAPGSNRVKGSGAHWIARKPNGAPLLHTLSGSEAGCWKILLARWRKHLPGLPGAMGIVTKREAKRDGITITRCELNLNAEGETRRPSAPHSP